MSNKPSIDDRVSALGIWHTAESFFNSGVTLKEHGEATLPIYYNYAHAIELALKAYLFGAGLSEKKLRDLGHDLEEVFREAEGLGLENIIELKDVDIEVIKMINPYYCSKELEYYKRGIMRLPELGYMHSTAEILIQGLKKFCADATILGK